MICSKRLIHLEAKQVTVFYEWIIDSMQLNVNFLLVKLLHTV